MIYCIILIGSIYFRYQDCFEKLVYEFEDKINPKYQYNSSQIIHALTTLQEMQL